MAAWYCAISDIQTDVNRGERLGISQHGTDENIGRGPINKAQIKQSEKTNCPAIIKRR